MLIDNKMLSDGVKKTFIPQYSSESSFVIAKESAASNYDIFWDTTVKSLKYYDSAWKVLPLTNRPVCGRLTNSSGNPYGTIASNISTIYFTPYKGNTIFLYTDGIWKLYTFSEISLSLSGYTADKNFDIFLYDNSGTLTLASVEWSDNNTIGYTRIYNEGTLTRSSSYTNWIFLGTIRTSGTGVTENSLIKRYIINYYNKLPLKMYKFDGTDNTYTTANYRYYNNDSSNRIEFVCPLKYYVVKAITTQVAYSSVVGYTNYNGIGLNGISTLHQQFNRVFPYTSVSSTSWSRYEDDFANDGYNFLTMVQGGSSNVTFQEASIEGYIEG